MILLLRVEDLTRVTDFYVARSRNGINFTVETEPVNYPMQCRAVPGQDQGTLCPPRASTGCERHGAHVVELLPDLEF